MNFSEAVISILILVLSSSTSEYCQKSLKTCTADNDQKYLFYDVNPYEGFNLRRDVYMRYAIMLSEARAQQKHLNWNLVLPPFYNLYHWSNKIGPVPWSQYFDIPSLNKFAPVVELHDLLDNNLLIDVLYVLQNYPDPFEGGTFKEKWEILDENDCQYNSFWGYKANVTVKETICVKFQGKSSNLWELVALHPNDKKIMLAHAEIPLHSHYGDKRFWDCRKSMKFNTDLINKAKEYMKTNFDCTHKCDNYISAHLRRKDFVQYRKKDVPTINGIVTQIKTLIKELKLKKVFIATDGEEKFKSTLKNKLKSIEVFYFEPVVEDILTYNDGGIAIMDQIIASHAKYFIGTHESTFSFRIQEEREILGLDSKSTFNVFCPDSGSCKEPSKWYIIH